MALLTRYVAEDLLTGGAMPFGTIYVEWGKLPGSVDSAPQGRVSLEALAETIPN